MVLMRAMSRLALRISLGVSKRSVADWKRRWNKFRIVSLSVRTRCSSLMARNSAGFMVPLPYGISPLGLAHRRPPRYKAAAERHLVGHTSQDITRRCFWQTTDFKENHTWLDHSSPVFGFALAFTHACLGRNGRYGFVGKHADVQTPFPTHRVHSSDAAGLDGLGAEPAAFEGL